MIHEHDGFSAGLVLSPVCCLEIWALDTVSYRDGNRRQLRLWRTSTDINVNVPIVSVVWYWEKRGEYPVKDVDMLMSSNSNG